MDLNFRVQIREGLAGPSMMDYGGDVKMEGGVVEEDEEGDDDDDMEEVS
jgi:hypothetical protein